MIRFGVVGTNWITERFLDGAKLEPRFQFAAVYSRTEERAQEFADKYDVKTIFTDIHNMAESDEIDAVYIASPNSFHASQAIVFLEQGKHVLCEKPIASNATELKRMRDAARKHNVVLMEAMKPTLVPNFKVAKDNLPKIGKVRRYFASYCQYSSRYDAYKQGNILNAFKPEFSNGALMDIGIYCLYPLIVLFGKPDKVQATGVMLDSGVDGEGSILLTYKDMDAVIMYSKITNSELPCEIQGEEGNLIFDQMNVPEKVEIRYRNGSKEELTQTQERQAMFYEVEEFINIIQSGQQESTINSIENSLMVLEIMDECRRQLGIIYPADQI
ncbi:Gfo/Idh/MocA family oxidoreductase [Mesobacillus maritimus]|uniref:Gfo/Idh/MocA family protein n=1 Tax=Mesobacillus maritimus TaxID=1643336 RepID=UPI00203BCC9B|nr:Gfo/Idh/MocA family oxidoreductase [Mesobacillus maritimus]MCM3585105.1 Gfo/Idh/MocA family oxidoreductase [Mesobacillus maritimus]MCM3670327.1 Gfo/Idh/MocA family oxidoreductase [Mesobacillus maritimus]